MSEASEEQPMETTGATENGYGAAPEGESSASTVTGAAAGAGGGSAAPPAGNQNGAEGDQINASKNEEDAGQEEPQHHFGTLFWDNIATCFFRPPWPLSEAGGVPYSLLTSSASRTPMLTTASFIPLWCEKLHHSWGLVRDNFRACFFRPPWPLSNSGGVPYSLLTSSASRTSMLTTARFPWLDPFLKIQFRTPQYIQ
ncbi:uncharacterized protein LOC118929262 isoform X3 [Manis pentadactyla]|uniref:uncharacterized protein LOC118929262 isoform X3 n=1 Tax=Manis pentadactyla TaxID=143292 RepID=UPI00255D1020|nr:uncharacterized protein LOC118929262 isoform X3 [Manis pentadactyla]